MNSIFDLKKFYKLIITPYELEIAYSNWNNFILYDT
jgi:diphthamide synthase subunit DPH2